MEHTTNYNRSIAENNNKSNSRKIAIAGNPNVGKSTIFNNLTGLNQHTGNWAGKTVETAKGEYSYRGTSFTVIDLPGTYSLISDSIEEEIARDFLCFNKDTFCVVVMDACCIERNLNLALKIKEINPNILLCVNILDEATKKGIKINLEKLSNSLGVPVVGTSFKDKLSIEKLKNEIYKSTNPENKRNYTDAIKYPKILENAINHLQPIVKKIIHTELNFKWIALKLIDADEGLNKTLKEKFGVDLLKNKEINAALEDIKNDFKKNGVNFLNIKDIIAMSVAKTAEKIYKNCVTLKNENYNNKDRTLDKFLTSKLTGIPIMLLLLFFVFWVTIVGANYPSSLLSDLLFFIQEKLTISFRNLHIPTFLHGALVLGVYRTVAWVVSVMLPPMAIFFPLFTLLEDLGYLPRVSFNMDNFLEKAGTNGKQALTMCMGFGCNACAVVGCRIINSKRERLIAILTNNFIPCNGRFPTLIAIITMFFTASISLKYKSLISTLILTLTIVFGVFVSLIISKLLSKTLLKGIPSYFSLELPPYRRPQIGKLIIRSIFDRTLFVLYRAILVAAPAGLLIWCLSNINVNDISLLKYCTSFLDPFAKIIGLDGVILMAFILGFPANEIVMPIIVMAYLCAGSLTDVSSPATLCTLLTNNGWSTLTALCTMLFSLMHFPCGTTLLTIHNETKSTKWTALAFILPTLVGLTCCFLVNGVAKIFRIIFCSA